MTFAARGLPPGVKLNVKTGILSGKVAKSGDYPIQVFVKNAHGQAKATIMLRVGKTLCLTPPMGWNSWYSFNEALSQDGVLKTARLMEESGLGDHGWSYVNMDDCWQGERGGPLKAIQSNERFRDMKAMCDEVHSRGFKIGIYSGPWVPVLPAVAAITPKATITRAPSRWKNANSPGSSTGPGRACTRGRWTKSANTGSLTRMPSNGPNGALTASRLTGSPMTCLRRNASSMTCKTLAEASP